MRILKALATLLVLAGCGPTTEESPDLPDRVFILGVEALSEVHLDRMLEAGELPNFARIIEGGTRASSRSTQPMDRVSLWNSVLSGKLPYRTGAVGPFLDLPTGQRSVTPSTTRQGKVLWQMLSDNAVMSAVVGFPGSWPAEVINGFLVSPAALPTRWMETHENTFKRVPGFLDTYPPLLYGEIEPMIRDSAKLPRETASRFFTMTEEEFVMLYDLPLGSILRKTNPLKDFAMTISADESNVDIAMHLLSNYRPRVVATHLELLGSLQPVYWAFLYPEVFHTPPDYTRRFNRAVDEGYKWVDEQLGRILDAMTERSALVVCSDHGFDTIDPPVEVQAGGRKISAPTELSPLIFYGQGVRGDHELPAEVRNVDITPTILALLGSAIAMDMDGTVLSDVFTETFRSANKSRYIDSYDEGWDQSGRYPPTGLERPEGTAPVPPPEGHE